MAENEGSVRQALTPERLMAEPPATAVGLSLVRLSPVGAEVIGLDLGSALDEATRRTVVNALHAHQLLIFRDQRLSPGQQVAFARTFGRVGVYRPDEQIHRAHPEHREILRISDAYSIGADHWHTDGLEETSPPSVTMLYPQQLPATGGDTLFVDAYAAYGQLPQNLQQALEGRRMLHGPGRVGHPIVRTHPVTGRKALYIELVVYRSRIEGMGSRQKEALIRELLAHVERPELVYRHCWREGDLVVWDNAAVLHRGTETPAGEPRLLHRVTVCGTVPV
jgi:taurine dioxygenase